MKFRILGILALALAFGNLVGTTARAGVVTNLNDSGAGSLRAAMAAAVAGEVITFQPGLTGTLYLTSGTLAGPFISNITIQGPGANVITIDGSLNGNANIFNFAGTSSFWRTATVTGLTLQNATADYGGCLVSAGMMTISDVFFYRCHAQSTMGFAGGGGVLYTSGAPNSLTITNCTFMECTSNGDGGAIESIAPMSIANSTFWGNSAAHYGGAVAITNASSAQFNHVTMAGNYAAQAAGGVYIYTGLVARNSIISGNSAGNGTFSDMLGPQGATFDHCIAVVPGPFGLVVDLGGNYFGIQGLVNAPADHGGTMPTCDLATCSKAIDNANPANALGLDQRGVARPIGAGPDMGAYENPLPDPNKAPELSPADMTLFTGQEDVPLSTNQISLTDPDVCDGELTVTISAAKGALSVANVAPSTITGEGTSLLVATANLTTINAILAGLTLTPPADFNGDIPVTVEVSDNGFTGTGGAQVDTVTHVFRFTPVNDPPSLTLDAEGVVYADEDAPPTSISLWAYNIFPGPSDEALQNVSLAITSVSDPGLFSEGPTVSNDGTLSFRPAPNKYGISTVLLVATDDGASDAPNINKMAYQGRIEILPVNDAPTAVDDYITVAEGDTAVQLDSGALSVLANDYDIDSTLLVAMTDLVVPTQHGIATLTAAGTFIYVNDGSNYTEDYFVYRVCDVDQPILCSTATVYINIIGTNDAPYFVAPFPANPVISNTNQFITFTLHAEDPDNNPLSFGLLSGLPAEASIDSTSGMFLWTPQVWDEGVYTAEFVVTDGFASDQLTVFFNIVAVDTDGDGVPDGWETLNNMNPENPDSDGDTIPDGTEMGPFNAPFDSDLDQIIDPLDTDSDGDGVSDYEEAGDDDLETPPVDSDQDETPDYLDHDSDNDGVPDGEDNCRVVANSGQADLDQDGLGDDCDQDLDGDGVLNPVDNCLWIANPYQEDTDLDYVGDACDLDRDGDQVLNDSDNCPDVYNPDQTDVDQDQIGDLCDNLIDYDGDDVPDAEDNCLSVYNPTQTDTDEDGMGDVCDYDDDNDQIPDGQDNCPLIPNQGQADVDGDQLGDLCDPDIDGDSVPNEVDNCPYTASADLSDTDMDGMGDACDLDDDNDQIPDETDNCPYLPNPGQLDTDQDLEGDACDLDDDNDQIPDEGDNCPLVDNPGQEDLDEDLLGDACDDDDDGDAVADPEDNCPLVYNPQQTNTDQDFQGDACDEDDDNDQLVDGDDNCPLVANPGQEDEDGDGIGDACDTAEPPVEQVESDPVEPDEDVQVEPEDDTVQPDAVEPEDDTAVPDPDQEDLQEDLNTDLGEDETEEVETDTAVEPAPDLVAPDTGTDSTPVEIDSVETDSVETDANAETDTVPEADAGSNLVLEGGSACSASAHAGSTTGMLALGALLLASWALMRGVRRRRQGVAALCLAGATLLAASGAGAQEVDLNAFDVSPFFGDGLVTVRGQTLEGRWDIGLFLDYQNDPLHYKNTETGDVVRYVIEHQVTAQLFGAIGLTKWFDLGLVLPLVGFQSGDGFVGGDAPSTASIGDVRLVPRLRFVQAQWEKGRFDVALVPEFTAPTGQLVDPYTGEKGFTATPMLAASLEHGMVGVAANAGVRFRASSDLGSSTVDNDVLLRGAIYLHLVPELLTVDAEVISSSPLSNLFGERASPLELLGGGRLHLNDSVDVSVGAGMGITDGPATPAFRLLAGLRYSPSPKPEVLTDRDGDGIPDVSDKCPDEAEDPDGFQDQDGCPDKDNDQDSILDSSDKCINDPEDLDGYQDSDGCPDADNDSDKVCDPWVAQRGVHKTYESLCKGSDQCPDEPEDMDGYQDEDGCPDVDHDGDKICDPWVAEKGQSEKFVKVCTGSDQCPEQPETANGYRDEDGCPDELPKQAVLEEKTIAIPLVHFEYDSTKLIPESEKIIKQVAEILKQHPEILKVKVVGHTDSHGTDEYNQALSERRAKAIVDLLVRYGVAKNRLEYEGKGRSAPLVSSEQSEEDRQLNRRVEFLILEKKQAGPQ